MSCSFSDTEPIQALQAILEHKPSLIVLERLFAATPRGAALINRIKNDPQLGHAEVRVMSHTGDYSREVSKPSRLPRRRPGRAAAGGMATAPSPTEAPPGAATVGRGAAAAAARLARHAARAAVSRPRGRRDPARWQSGAVVDLSQVGAQVMSPTILRPNQKVRVSMPNDDFVMRFRGAIAWAKFELPAAERAAPLSRRRRVHRRRRRRGRIVLPEEQSLAEVRSTPAPAKSKGKSQKRRIAASNPPFDF